MPISISARFIFLLMLPRSCLACWPQPEAKKYITAYRMSAINRLDCLWQRVRCEVRADRGFHGPPLSDIARVSDGVCADAGCFAILKLREQFVLIGEFDSARDEVLPLNGKNRF